MQVVAFQISLLDNACSISGTRSVNSLVSRNCRKSGMDGRPGGI